MRNLQLPVIGFVAPSGSGKTTLLRRLVPVLTGRGLRIGYLKHAHHRFELDVPGKDSYEVRAAGARQVLLASQQRWALQSEPEERGKDPALEEMLGRFDADRLDLVLVEGFKHAAYPKIEVHRPTLGKPPLYPQDPDIIAVVTDRELPGADHPPRLSAEDPEAIADFVQGHMATWSPPRSGPEDGIGALLPLAAPIWLQRFPFRQRVGARGHKPLDHPHRGLRRYPGTR